MQALRPFLTVVAGLLIAAPSAALAQASDEAAAPEAAEVSTEPASTDGGLPIRRGFYAAGDFGGYFSFGGRNTVTGGSKSVSNFQPMIGATVGYDLVSNASLNLAVGLRLAAAYNAGSGRVSAAEAADQAVARTIPSDFGIYQVGIGSKLGFMVLERLAVNGLVDVGLGIGNPDPGAAAQEPGGGGAAFGLAFGAGAGIEFFTLFPGFSIGLEAKFMGSLLGGKFIPGLGVTAPLKFNF